MSNNLRNHMKKDTIKWIAVTLAILLICVALAAALTNGFRDANPYCWLGHTYEKGSTVCSVCGEPCEHTHWKDGKCKECGFVCEHEFKNGKCTICGEKDPAKEVSNHLEVESSVDHGIKLMSAIMPMAVDTVTITATVTPSDAVVDLKWEMSGISSPSDYIDLQVNGNKKSATVSVKKPFGSVITLKASSESKPSVYAECTFNYIKRIEGLDSAVKFTQTTASGSSITVRSGIVDKMFTFNYDSSPSSNDMYYQLDKSLITYGTGTKEDSSLSLKVEFTFNSAFLSALSSSSSIVNSGPFYSNTSSSNISSPLKFDSTMFSLLFKSSYVSGKDYSALNKALTTSDGKFLDVKFTATNSKGSQSATYTIKVDPSSFSVLAGNVELDHSNIDF